MTFRLLHNCHMNVLSCASLISESHFIGLWLLDHVHPSWVEDVTLSLGGSEHNEPHTVTVETVRRFRQLQTVKCIT